MHNLPELRPFCCSTSFGLADRCFVLALRFGLRQLLSFSFCVLANIPGEDTWETLWDLVWKGQKAFYRRSSSIRWRTVLGRRGAALFSWSQNVEAGLLERRQRSEPMPHGNRASTHRSLLTSIGRTKSFSTAGTASGLDRRTL